MISKWPIYSISLSKSY